MVHADYSEYVCSSQWILDEDGKEMNFFLE